MNLSALIRGQLPITSSEPDVFTPTVARVASVAVANIKEEEIKSNNNFVPLFATATPATPATQDDDSGLERRRQRVLTILADPAMRLAIVVDDANADPIRVAVGIRSVATADLEIPRACYDPETLLELLERHAQGVDP